MTHLKIAIKLFLVMSVITGILYPLSITVIAQVFFHSKANGSLLMKDDRVLGSTLIAQRTSGNGYFFPRPSAIDYDPLKPSGGSNLGPTSKILKGVVEGRRQKLGENAPAELIYSSGSGLDPHISLTTAYYQLERVAKARSIDPEELKKIIELLAEGRLFGFLKPRYINVLILNHYLDEHYARGR